MTGKLPIGRVRETLKSSKVLLRHGERLAKQDAELRDADDPVAAARPPASDTTRGSAGEPPKTELLKRA